MSDRRRLFGRGSARGSGTESDAVETSAEVEPIDSTDDADTPPGAEVDQLTEGPDPSKSAPEDRADTGPFDESEANPVRPYVDLGGVKILPREGLHLRLEVEEGSKRVVAVALDYAGSTLQVQPFAAPRTTGLWNEIRAQIAEQIDRQGGTTQLADGPFGPELLAQIPTVQTAGDGSTRLARFIGVDGPRWFLRGVVAGEGAVDAEAAAKVDDLFRSVVVVRGATPMPPRDLIPLHLPATAGAPAAPATDAAP